MLSEILPLGKTRIFFYIYIYIYMYICICHGVVQNGGSDTLLSYRNAWKIDKLSFGLYIEFWNLN